MASIRRKCRLPIALFLLLLFSVAEIHAQTTAPAKPQPPATILIIRHAEKLTDGRIDLSPTGFERARLLPKLFSPTSARPDLPTPQVLFATISARTQTAPYKRSPRSRQLCIYPSTTASATTTTPH